jgi:hypothetical protein
MRRSRRTAEQTAAGRRTLPAHFNSAPIDRAVRSDHGATAVGASAHANALRAERLTAWRGPGADEPPGGTTPRRPHQRPKLRRKTSRPKSRRTSTRVRACANARVRDRSRVSSLLPEAPQPIAGSEARCSRASLPTWFRERRMSEKSRTTCYRSLWSWPEAEAVRTEVIPRRRRALSLSLARRQVVSREPWAPASSTPGW